MLVVLAVSLLGASLTLESIGVYIGFESYKLNFSKTFCI